METFTLLFFVLMLLVAALIVTQTIRRDLKARERIEADTRRAHTHAPRALHTRHIQRQEHKPPQRTL